MHNNTKVLVLGGNGFIGTNVVERLNKANYSISVLDAKDPFQKIQGVSYLNGDLKDTELLDQALKDQQYLIYLCSATTPITSMQIPNKVYEQDLVLLNNVCQLSVKHNIKKIIYASSGGTVYGVQHIEEPFSEEVETYPINHYGIGKVAAEKILMFYNTVYSMNNIVLRISNPYGEGQDVNTGVGAITAFAKKIINDEKITVFGDGENIRDYVHISDVAEAFVLALQDISSPERPIYNIGSGEGISINEIIECIGGELGKKVSVEYGTGREFDVRYSVLDIKKAEKNIFYKPKIQVREGIKKYISLLKTSR